MPILVLEGPDESGKTTLAHMVRQQLAASGFGGVEYQRSPVKEFGWSYGYNNYLTDQIHTLEQFTPGRLLIQDRIPEISELVYGTVRGNPRGVGYSYGLYTWMGHNVLMVFCAGDLLGNEHFDATGKKLTNSNQPLVNKLYDQVYHDIRHCCIYSSSPMHVLKYDRHNKSSWHYTIWMIREWLFHACPDQASAIRKALSFEVDSTFPMPDMENKEPPL